MDEHEHDFPQARFREVVMCRTVECTEDRIGTKRGRLRALTPHEQGAITLHRMEAVVIAQTMMIIHGEERGMVRARQALGYDPEGST